MSLRDRLIKNSTIKETTLLSDSKIYAKKDVITTRVPLINAALSADFDGGLLPGLFLLAGPSKHFKSNFAILMAKAFMDKNPDGVILFYASDFGTPESYFKDMNIDNIVHTPIMDVEQLKHDIVNQLKSIEKNDKVFILVDSLGNLASKKELDDAEEGKTVADMTRAKSFKSLFRMVTPYLNTKDIPMVAIMHTYDTMEIYSKQVVSGGKGAYYSANVIWIIGRQQDKDSTGLKGYRFIINIEKSRFVKEGSKFPITVSFDGGIDKYSGIYDLAVEAGYIVKSGGWCQIKDLKTGELAEQKIRESNITEEWLDELIKSENFKKYIKDMYAL